MFIQYKDLCMPTLEMDNKRNRSKEVSCEDLVKFLCNLHSYLSFFLKQPSNADRRVSQLLVMKLCINSGLTQEAAYRVCQFLTDQLISDSFHFHYPFKQYELLPKTML